MRIAQITPEIYPYCAPDRRGCNQLKGNVLALSNSLALRGHDVFVFTPLYGIIDVQERQLKKTEYKTWVSVSGKMIEFEIYEDEIEGVKFYFFSNSDLFDRRGIYGYGNIDFTCNDVRFGAFCQACLNFINTNVPDIQIMHAHNWPAALIPVYKSCRYPDMKCETVLTVHDLSAQGIFSRFSMETLGLPWDMYTMERLEFYDNINLLKGGIVYSGAVIALNAIQAESFLMHDTGFGLDGVFRRYQHKLVSIPNGIDGNYWNPFTDCCLEQQYSVEYIEKRKTNKEKICAKYALDCQKPLFSAVSRYVTRDEIDVVLRTLPSIVKHDINLFLYGSGEEPYADKLIEKQKVYDNLRVVAGGESSVFHRILASADFIVIPYVSPSMERESRLAMRYGAIPLIRSFWKSDDTEKVSKSGAMRFKYRSLEELQATVQNAIELYYNKEEKEKYMAEIMQHDNSWEFTAKEHEELYKNLIRSAQIE